MCKGNCSNRTAKKPPNAEPGQPLMVANAIVVLAIVDNQAYQIQMSPEAANAVIEALEAHGDIVINDKPVSSEGGTLWITPRPNQIDIKQ